MKFSWILTPEQERANNVNLLEQLALWKKLLAIWKQDEITNQQDKRGAI